MKRVLATLLCGICVGLACGICLAGTAHESRYTVYTLHDCDTVVVYEGERLAFAGLSLPSRTSSYFFLQGIARHAQEFLESLMKGKKIIAVEEQTRDQRGRIPAFIYLEDGTFVNELLVQKGFARVKAQETSDVSRRAALLAAQREAKKNAVGVWAESRDKLKKRTTKLFGADDRTQ